MSTLATLGWREWVSLPELGIPHIKAKIDTGAKTSALHAFFVERYQHNGQDWVKFSMHPLQRRTDTIVHCDARLLDYRAVTDSGGHREQRCVIETTLLLGQERLRTELTLSNRETMQFRMLLGRNVLTKRYCVDVGRSYCLGRH